MTLQEALNLTDEMRPNMMERATKIAFLTEIEQLIYEEIVMKHEPARETRWPVRFLADIKKQIDSKIETASLLDEDALRTFCGKLRGQFHQFIIFHQTKMDAATEEYMTDLESSLAGTAADTTKTKAELITYLGTVGDTIQAKLQESSTVPTYNADTDQGTVLVVPDPYSMVYVYWLLTKIDSQNLEFDKYNSDRALFENAYDTMHDWWNRTYMPVQRHRQIHI